MAAIKGGYALIDCTGLDLGDLDKVDGLYDAILAAVNMNKLIVLNNIVNGNTSFSPIVGYGGTEEAGVFVSFYPVTLHVDSSDNVTM